jgi:hypothetical protein
VPIEWTVQPGLLRGVISTEERCYKAPRSVSGARPGIGQRRTTPIRSSESRSMEFRAFRNPRPCACNHVCGSSSPWHVRFATEGDRLRYLLCRFRHMVDETIRIGSIADRGTNGGLLEKAYPVGPRYRPSSRPSTRGELVSSSSQPRREPPLAVSLMFAEDAIELRP